MPVVSTGYLAESIGKRLHIYSLIQNCPFEGIDFAITIC